MGRTGTPPATSFGTPSILSTCTGGWSAVVSERMGCIFHPFPHVPYSFSLQNLLPCTTNDQELLNKDNYREHIILALPLVQIGPAGHSLLPLTHYAAGLAQYIVAQYPTGVEADRLDRKAPQFLCA